MPEYVDNENTRTFLNGFAAFFRNMLSIPVHVGIINEGSIPGTF